MNTILLSRIMSTNKVFLVSKRKTKRKNTDKEVTNHTTGKRDTQLARPLSEEENQQSPREGDQMLDQRATLRERDQRPVQLPILREWEDQRLVLSEEEQEQEQQEREGEDHH